jgi:NADPH2:quinone reductase
VRIGAGERVLVLAAAGGLGSLVVQLAVAAGAGLVVGAARGAQKRELVSSLGASAAVDYSEPDWIESVLDATGGRGLDVVFDGVGGAIGRAAFELLAEGSGRQVVYGYASGTPVQIEAAELVVEDAAAAHATIEARRAIGKTLLIP